MIEEFDNYTIAIKSKCKKIKNFLGISILASFILGIVYLIYWTMISNDKIVYEYTYKFFEPLALNLFPNAHGFEMYNYTALFMMGLSVPLYIACVICDKAEDMLLKIRQDVLEAKKRKEQLQQALEYQRQFDEINQYSICLSIDYLSNSKPVDKSLKEKLNQAVYLKLKEDISEVKCSINTYLSDVMIITSRNFDCYDWLYDVLLNSLAKAKKSIEEKYNFEFIPSLTTEAYTQTVPVDNIKKHHFDIQSCNFKNRACSNMLFSKKYNHINKNKYSGIPIGEYAVFEKNKINTYELNVIYKNLSYTLENF